MEKRKPHYELDDIKRIIGAIGMDAFTRIAQDNSRLMGLCETDTLKVVAGLARSMFFKSMTTHTDGTIWQDVYHAPCPNGKLAYIKVTIQCGAVVIQFKEK